MDWIRRNWPDLLIGIALVAVIAGIIATLLTGGSFFPLGPSERPTANQRPASSGPVAGGESRSGNDQADRSTGSSQRSSASNAAAARTSSEREGAGTSRRPIEVTALPLPGTPVANNIPATSGAAESGQDESASSNGGSGDEPPASTSQAAAQAPTPVGPANGDSRSNGEAGDDEGLYRISVGAFSSAANAEKQAGAFRQAGYPVFIGAQGDLSIVLVGPYDSLGEAERTAERIRSGDIPIEPVIYRFRSGPVAGQSHESPTGASAGSSAASSTSAAPTTPVPQPTASEAAGSRYLQVGAYATAKSAQPQRNRLEGIGFRVTERTEGGLVKLLVGPFAGDDLTAARSRLSERGIEHFPR